MISAREHLHHQLLKCCRSHATKMEWWQLIIQAIFCSEWYLLVDILVLYNWPCHQKRQLANSTGVISSCLFLSASSYNPYYALHAIPLVPVTLFCLIISRHRVVLPGRATNTHSMVNAEMCWGIVTAQKKSAHWKWLLLRRCYFMPSGWSSAPQNFKLRNASCLSLPLGFLSSHF